LAEGFLAAESIRSSNQQGFGLHITSFGLSQRPQISAANNASGNFRFNHPLQSSAVWEPWPKEQFE
jgi:hypothetical protein